MPTALCRESQTHGDLILAGLAEREMCLDDDHQHKNMRLERKRRAHDV